MNENRKLAPDLFFEVNPVFRVDEFARSQGKVDNPSAARQQLRYYAGRGRVKRVAREVYARIPPGREPNSFWPDPILVAACRHPEGVFSHHSALEILGASHTLWRTCTLYVQKSPSAQDLGPYRIQFLAPPKTRTKKELNGLGVRRAERSGRPILCTGPERTLVEGFRKPRWVGGVEELLTSASGFGVLELGLLESLLQAYGEAKLWAAVGWFLERHQGEFYVPGDYLERLAQMKPVGNRYLVRDARGGQLSQRWNLIVPEALLGWEGSRAER